jgi:hypothetical protein
MFFVETDIVVWAKMSHKNRPIFGENLTLFLGSEAPFGGQASMISSHFLLLH